MRRSLRRVGTSIRTGWDMFEVQTDPNIRAVKEVSHWMNRGKNLVHAEEGAPASRASGELDRSAAIERFRPLQGLVAVNLGLGLAAALAGKLLAEYGAHVIR